MKTIEELLNEEKNYEERVKELETLIPQINDNEIIYYDGKKYIYKQDNYIYSGSDFYSKDTKIEIRFPLLFFLESLYLAKDFAEKYNSNDNLKNDKSLQLNKFGLVELKGYGVVGNRKVIANLLNDN